MPGKSVGNVKSGGYQCQEKQRKTTFPADGPGGENGVQNNLPAGNIINKRVGLLPEQSSAVKVSQCAEQTVDSHGRDADIQEKEQKKSMNSRKRVDGKAVFDFIRNREFSGKNPFADFL